MYELLNVLVPCIHDLNHTGVALASQTLGCTQVLDEIGDFRALQCLIFAAVRSACTCTKIGLLVSYRLAFGGPKRDRFPLNAEALPRTPRRAQTRDFTSCRWSARCSTASRRAA